jgi:tripartite motif-containing protein 23
VPLSDKPREKPKCPSHPSHVAEFACLEDDCQTLQSGPGPIMGFIGKDYGRHKNHKVRYCTSNVSSEMSVLKAAL